MCAAGRVVNLRRRYRRLPAPRGHKRRTPRQTTLTGKWAELAAMCGGVSALAKELGVSEMSIWRWNAGQVQPSPRARERMAELVAGLPASIVTCPYCSERVPSVLAERDHVVPTARGGPDEAPNIVRCCVSCNRRKGDLLPSEWLDDVPEAIAAIEADVRASCTIGPAVNRHASVRVELRLDRKLARRLDEIATRLGETRSGMVERLVRDAEMPRAMVRTKP